MLSCFTDWQATHGMRLATLATRHKYDARKKPGMLENIIQEHPYTMIAGTIALTTAAVPIGLGAYGWWCTRDSPHIQNEAHAHAYFQQVCDHYGISGQLELRCTHRGLNYISRGEDGYIVFINTKRNAKEASIQHEVLHYVEGDIRLDPNRRSFFGKIASWMKYFFYLEPRIIRKTRHERIPSASPSHS